jgi:acyl-CoA thioesterase-1
MTFKKEFPLLFRIDSKALLLKWRPCVSQMLLRASFMPRDLRRVDGSYRHAGGGYQARRSGFVAAATAALWLVLAQQPAGAQAMKLVAFGDSLTAGYGVAAQDAFPVKLQQALAAKGIAAEIVNAGVSGDTASGGLSRLDWSLPDDAKGVILELGANDALRGIDPAVTRKALDQILARLKEKNIPVLLCGMRAPPNLGPEYAAKFDPIYAELAAQYGVIFYPFFLEGVAAERGLNQGDGIHPTAAGVDVIVRAILPKVEELIAKVK